MTAGDINPKRIRSPHLDDDRLDPHGPDACSLRFLSSFVTTAAARRGWLSQA
jgi:hypothetical protein